MSLILGHHVDDNLDSMDIKCLANDKAVVLHELANQVNNMEGMSLTVDLIK